MLRAAFLLTCLAWTGPALAVEIAKVSLPGKAVIGSESRDVALGFDCIPQSRTHPGLLYVTLSVPNFEALETRFNFDAFHGPEGTRKPLTEITVAQAERMSASGHIGMDSTSFVLGVGASLRGDARDLAKIRPLLAAASAGPGALRWRQESPRKGDSPILVTVPIAAADADRLKAVLAPCLKGK
jgi:hypothetical protein